MILLISRPNDFFHTNKKELSSSSIPSLSVPHLVFWPFLPLLQSLHFDLVDEVSPDYLWGQWGCCVLGENRPPLFWPRESKRWGGFPHVVREQGYEGQLQGQPSVLCVCVPEWLYHHSGQEDWGPPAGSCWLPCWLLESEETVMGSQGLVQNYDFGRF